MDEPVKTTLDKIKDRLASFNIIVENVDIAKDAEADILTSLENTEVTNMTIGKDGVMTTDGVPV
jgi:hypothetical protein